MLLVDDAHGGAYSKEFAQSTSKKEDEDFTTIDVRFAVLSGLGYTLQWMHNMSREVIGQCPLSAVKDVYADDEQIVLTIQHQRLGDLETVTLLRPDNARWNTAWIEAGLNYLRDEVE